MSVYEDPDQVAVYKELATWYKEGLLNQDCAQLADDPDDFVVISYPGWEGSEAIRSEGKDYDAVINKNTARLQPVRPYSVQQTRCSQTLNIRKPL